MCLFVCTLTTKTFHWGPQFFGTDSHQVTSTGGLKDCNCSLKLNKGIHHLDECWLVAFMQVAFLKTKNLFWPISSALYYVHSKYENE